MYKFDKIIIVDVESTCWEGGTPAEQISENITSIWNWFYDLSDPIFAKRSEVNKMLNNTF